MSEYNWSPGPWKESKWGDMFDADGERVCAYDIRISLVTSSPNKRDRANGRLLRHAGDLADTLVNLRSEMAEARNEIDVDDWIEMIDEALGKITDER